MLVWILYLSFSSIPSITAHLRRLFLKLIIPQSTSQNIIYFFWIWTKSTITRAHLNGQEASLLSIFRENLRKKTKNDTIRNLMLFQLPTRSVFSRKMRSGIGSKVIIAHRLKCFIVETMVLSTLRNLILNWLLFSLRNKERYAVESKLIVMFQNIALVLQET